MDKLKILIDEHREEFDEWQPSEQVWAGISNSLQDVAQVESKDENIIQSAQNMRVTWHWKRLSIAAATVTLLMLAGLSAYRLGQYNALQQQAANSLENINPKMAEVEGYYAQMIRQKQTQLSRYDLKIVGLEGESDTEMASLDSSYKQLKQELLANPNQQKIVDAMTRNLQMRMLLLSRQLEILQKINHQKINKNENISL